MDWTQYWNPYLSIENVLGDNVKDESWHVLTFDGDGVATVCEKHRCKGSFLEYLELNQFPFDTQVNTYMYIKLTYICLLHCMSTLLESFFF